MNGSSKKTPSPLSLRLTLDEHKRLKRDAGAMSQSAYIRQKLIGDNAAPRSKRYTQKQRTPGIDHKALAQLLGTLGQSELGRSMIALSLAAQCGALAVDDELTEKLHTVCDDISAMRNTLIVALGIKAEH